MEHAENKIKQLEAEVKKWKNHHKDLVERLRLFTQRDDVPVDRIPAYQELVRLQGIEAKVLGYGNSLGLRSNFPLDIDGLIDSHRHLRSLNLEDTKHRRESLRDLLEFYEAEKKKERLISLNELQEMTIEEISQLLRSEPCNNHLGEKYDNKDNRNRI